MKSVLCLLVIMFACIAAGETIKGIQTGFSDTRCSGGSESDLITSVLIQAGVIPDVDPVDVGGDRKHLRNLQSLPEICRWCENQWGVGVCRYWYGFCNSRRHLDEGSIWENETFESLSAKCHNAVSIASELSDQDYDGFGMDTGCNGNSFFCVVVEEA